MNEKSLNIKEIDRLIKKYQHFFDVSLIPIPFSDSVYRIKILFNDKTETNHYYNQFVKQLIPEMFQNNFSIDIDCVDNSDNSYLVLTIKKDVFSSKKHSDYLFEVLSFYLEEINDIREIKNTFM